jgi:membrane protein implicated in regulation of membrane protease activity
MMVVLWLVVVLAFAILEVATVSLFAAWVAIGALAAAAASAAGADIVVQSVVFAGVSLLGLVLLRPPLLRYVQRRRARGMGSGADGMIGQDAPVVEAIGGHHEPGHVRIGGENWPAVTEDGAAIPAGSAVKVVGLRGATLIVTNSPVTTKEGVK